MFKEPMVVLVQLYWGGWADQPTGHEYLVAVPVARRFVRFWNRDAQVEATGKWWAARDL